ncbi:hypothetical protein O1611_g8621 [Lasiodiplodia mahajangana]|uniref:Uncharacterized protein n=1 Tax=Lasiodiplodia mahajangana TaxID=1108764 RepID=A0ACC2JCJ7_9PEZI|nr:hypothetical protein O1611_g8621 [Lasiodiplodia mahajangana]
MQPLEQPMPPPPNISHPGIVTIDITDHFASAIKTLLPGEIVKDEHFALFESVSALEIMDRKMDSGVLDEGESLDEEYDVTRNLLPEEILGIIDQLLSLEMAWHLGYPLSQTVLTSVYVEALMNPLPRTPEEVNFTRTSSPLGKGSLLFALRAYCAGLLKACFFVNECMKEELYYEEEDFVTNTYERNLLSHVPVSDIKGLLRGAVTDLRASRDDFPPEICTALEARLELRIAFLDAIDLSIIRNDTTEAPKLPWIEMRRLIEDIEKQHGLAKPVPEAFSTKLQRRLASTMPPRPMVKLSFEECTPVYGPPKSPEFYSLISSPKAPATGLYQDSAPESPIQGHGGARPFQHPSATRPRRISQCAPMWTAFQPIVRRRGATNRPSASRRLRDGSLSSARG